jgi:hypothetical protein
MGGAVEYGYASVRGGGRVAYQVVGDGPLDVLVSRPPGFPIDMMWDEPRVLRFLDRLSSFVAMSGLILGARGRRT